MTATPNAAIPKPIATAERLYATGATAEAATILESLIRDRGEIPAALRLLGLCRVRQGDPAALPLLQRARELAPQDAYAALHYGIGLLAAGRHAEAARIFRDCQARLPEDPAPPLNLASSLLLLGDHTGALRAARRATLRAPNLAQAHYVLGQARLAVGHPRAIDSFARAVQLDPGFADAWVNLGVAHYRRYEMAPAIAAMRRALAASPGHRAATANLGAFLRLTGAADEAEALLRDHLARDPGANEVRVNLAADLLAEERANEALALLDAAVPRDASLKIHWQAQRTLGLIQMRRLGEARQALDAIGAAEPLRPLLLWRRILIAAGEGDEGTARRHADEMEAALADGADLLPEHRIMAYFDLAKFWSQRDADRAFPLWVQAHRLLGRIQPFDRAAYRAFVDASIAAFTRARMHLGPRASNADPAPVFIVGMPRSGTTLAEQILAAHPAMFGAGERDALAACFARLGGAWESAEAVRRIAALDQATLDATATAYLANLHAGAPEARYVLDKMPGNFRLLGLVSLLLPGARIIHCTRDPRDIGLSIFTFRFYGYHPYAHDLSDLGWYIGEHERLMAHWRAVLPNPILVLPLSDWVVDFPGTLRRVLGFLDLPHDPACEHFHLAERRVRTVSRTQVREPVNARGIGRWRPYARHLAPLIDELAAAGVQFPA